ANIEEVWKISQITEHNVNHITFCLTDGSTARFIMKLFSCNGIPKEYRDNVLNEHDCFGQRFIDDKQANYSNRSFGLPQSSICENNQKHMNDGLID
ncbi:19276_t:CDS:2, partial [Gigaspora rosea]